MGDLDLSYAIPSVSDFKAYFVRDFPYGSTPSTVTDADITSAMQDAAVNFNNNLWASQQSFNVGFLNLSAHFLVLNLRASSQGISGQSEWLHGSKAVGSVSESFVVPQRILDNPEFAWLTSTYYGKKYLMLVLPSLTGQMFGSYNRPHA